MRKCSNTVWSVSEEVYCIFYPSYIRLSECCCLSVTFRPCECCCLSVTFRRCDCCLLRLLHDLCLCGCCRLLFVPWRSTVRGLSVAFVPWLSSVQMLHFRLFRQWPLADFRLNGPTNLGQQLEVLNNGNHFLCLWACPDWSILWSVLPAQRGFGTNTLTTGPCGQRWSLTHWLVNSGTDGTDCRGDCFVIPFLEGVGGLRAEFVCTARVDRSSVTGDQTVFW